MDTTLGTLVKGLNVLEALARSGEPRGVTELAQELGLLKSNVHRLLRTLAARGYVRQQGASGRYFCTLKLWELGSGLTENIDVVTVARPQLTELARLTNETIHLSVLDDGEVIYVDKIDSPQPVRAYSRAGGRAPAYCVATGKALLAHMDGARFNPSAGPLQAHTERTITDPAVLDRELRKVRENGYAINRGEWRESVGGVAAPIFGSHGQCVAAIGVSGPLERLTMTRLRLLAPHVITAAQTISQGLGAPRR
ncbi:MAG: IclR family transcriptional regulator [Burkholderiaceae bacterium]